MVKMGEERASKRQGTRLATGYPMGLRQGEVECPTFATAAVAEPYGSGRFQYTRTLGAATSLGVEETAFG